jgi:hypothetical protein
VKRIILAVLIALCIPAPAQAPFQPLAFPVFRALDSNAKPLNGGLLFSFAAGTTTPLATYTDATGVSPNTNPVILDSTGTARVFLSSAAYKFILQNQFGVVQWTVDNIVGSGTQLISVGSGGFGIDLSNLSGCPTLAAGSPSAWTVTQQNCFTNGATWSSPLQFGAISNGSTSTITLSGTSGSGNLTLSSSANFGKGQGIMIAHAGAVCGSARGGNCTSPPTPSAATSGSAGTTTYTYQLACIDGLGGVGVAGGVGSIATGNATLAGTHVGSVFGGNYNIVSWTGNSTCTEVAIYRNGALVASEYSAPSGTMTYNDVGIAAWTNRDIPATPPTVALSDNYSGMITAFTGTTATASPNLGANVTGAIAYHNDTPLMQAAIAKSTFVSIPPGNYLISYPINYTKAGATVAQGISGSIVGPGTLSCDTGDICLDVTGDDNIVLSQFTMSVGPTNPSAIQIYCSRDSTLHGGVAQNVLTDHLIISNRNGNSLGGRGGVAFYNHACEIQHNYEDQFQSPRWTVLTSNNVDHVSSPFDGNDILGTQSMSEVEFYSPNGFANILAEIEDAFSITFIGGYGLGGSDPAYPWGFQAEGNVGRLTIDKFRLEGRGGVIDITNGSTLNEPYVDVDTYRVAPVLGFPQFRLNGTASISYADMLRSDDYGGSSGSISALVDGDSGCSVNGSIMRLGIFETPGTCLTTGRGNSISGLSIAPGVNNADWSLPPTYQLSVFASPTWVKLGTWVSNTPGVGDSLHIAFFTGNNFNQGTNAQSMADVVVRNANGLGSAPNISGATLFAYGSNPFTGLKIVATGGSTSVTNQSWDIYVDAGAQSAGIYRIDKESSDQWIASNTTSSDPGVASSTVVVGMVQSIPAATTATPSGTCTPNGFIPMVIGGTTVHIATCN